MRTLIIATCLWSATASASPELDARHEAAIRAAAAKFTEWGRVDERPNWAPTLCRAPTPADYGAPGHVRMSAAEHAPHGQKLYYLWASHKDVYLKPDGALPVGFAIVKQSFAAAPFDPAHPPPQQRHRLMGPLPPIATLTTADGKRFTVGERKDLFVMTKVGDVPGSDDGWIYGTVSPDGKVTSAGRVASCMACHTGHATHERLFGLPVAPVP